MALAFAISHGDAALSKWSETFGSNAKLNQLRQKHAEYQNFAKLVETRHREAQAAAVAEAERKAEQRRWEEADHKLAQKLQQEEEDRAAAEQLQRELNQREAEQKRQNEEVALRQARELARQWAAEDRRNVPQHVQAH